MSARHPDFIGRDADLERAAEMIARRERLITVAGPGGIGKTRLARELMRSLADDFERALWCDLTEARGVEGVEEALAAAMPDRITAAEMEQLGPTLLVLDNCEQVVDEIARAVSGWLDDAPDLVVVATSRERLRIPREVVLELGPLAPGDAGDLLLRRARRVGGDAWALARMSHHPDGCETHLSGTLARTSSRPSSRAAARSGVRCGGAAQSSSLPTPLARRGGEKSGLGARPDPIEELVRQLDGMPLAIELAAARAAVLSPAQLAERLSRRFETLAVGARNDAGRHQTLGATIDWSWQLLDTQERATLAALSVFRGGFDVDAAEAVVPPSAVPVIDRVQSLRDKSLVRTTEGQRLGLYVSIRDYAADHLAADPDARAAAEARHAAHYAALGRRIAEAVDERGASDAVERAASEQDNMAAVAGRALDRAPADADALALAADCLLALEPLRTARGPLAGYAAQLDRLLAAPGAAGLSPSIRARLHLARGRAHELAGDVARAAGDYQQALRHAADAGDWKSQNRLLLRLGVLAVQAQRWDDARDHYEVARLLAQKAGDRLTEGRALSNLGVVASETSEYQAARDLFDQAREIYLELGDTRREAVVLGNVANVLQDQGLLPEARAQLERVIATLEELGDQRTAAIFRGVLGTVDHEEGDLAAAERRYREAAAELSRVGDHQTESVLHGYAAAAAASAGRVREASSMVAQAEARLVDAGDAPAMKALSVHRAHIDLARAIAADAAGDEDLASELRGSVRDVVGRWRHDPPPQKVRAALRLLRSDLDADARAARSLVIGPDAVWFRVPGADRVDLSRRDNLRLVLTALADQHRRGGPPLDAVSLFTAGWPGERARADAAANRVRVAIATLRKLGLRAYLVTADEGYALAGDVVAVPAPNDPP